MSARKPRLPRWWYSIRLKLTLGISLLIASISTFVYFFFPAQLEEQALTALAEKAVAVANMTASNVAPALSSDDRPAVCDVVISAKRNPDLDYVMVVDDTGGLIASFHADRANELEYHRVRIASVSADDLTYQVVVPIKMQEQVLGEVYLGLSLKDLQTAIANSRKMIAVLCLGISAVGILVVFIFSTIITTPLIRMLKVAENIAAGDWTQRAHIAAMGEVGQLAGVFDRMVDNVELAYRELRQSEERNRFLSDGTSEGIAVMEEGKIIDSNIQLAEMLGYDRRDILGINLFDLIHSEDREFVRQRVGYEGLEASEYRMIRSDGAVIHVEAREQTCTYQGRRVRMSAVRDITDWKVAERELRFQKARFEQLFENAPIGVVLCDRMERILHANSVFQEMFGHSLDDLCGQRLNDILLPPNLGEEGTAYANRVLAGESIHGETVRQCKDGSLIDVDVYGIPILVNGESVGLFGMYVDISKRKNAERELQLLAHTVASTKDCVTITDLEDKIIFANEAFTRNYGYTREEVIGKPIAMLRSERTSRAIRENILPTTLGGGWYGEIYNRRKDGSEFPIELWTSVVRDDAGAPLAMVGVARDITERKRTEEALRASEEKYRDFFNEDLAGAFTSTPDGQLLSCNPSFARIFGFASVDEALSHRLTDFYPSRKQYEEMRDLVLVNRKLEHHEMRLQRCDGRTIFVIQNVMAKYDSGGTLTEIKGYIFDNTRHRLLEEQLRQAQKMESIGTLAGGIAHDFNNILAIIMGHTHLLMKGDAELVRKANSVETIQRATQRGTKLVKQILTFARRDETVFEPINLNHVIEELHRMLAETFPKMIDFSLRLDPALPVTVADPNQIHQALLNLCVNARDAMPTGGTLTIESKLVRGMFLRDRYPDAHEHLYACICVSDSGVGIPQELLARMFEPFFTTKEIGKGTGLGLAVVYGVTKSHQGFVDVASDVNRGTTFTLYFPIRRSEAKGDDKLDVQTTESSAGLKSVLVVEDEAVLLELVRRMLESRGFNVLAALDGVEAIDIYARRKDEIGLVLTDLGLPKLDGYEAFQRMKEINPDVKVIFASGYIDQALRDNLLNAGAVDLVQKPYLPDEILNRVRELVEADSDTLKN